MTVAARIDMSLTLNQMMDSMMAGVEKTGVLLLILQFAALQQLQSYRPLHLTGLICGGCRNSEDEDDGDADYERREAQSRTVTAMQFAAYRLHERAFESNDFWDGAFCFMIPSLSM